MSKVNIMNANEKGLSGSGVYFLRNNKNNMVKIGMSKNINERLKTLYATAKHVGEVKPDLELINCVLCDRYSQLESDMHKLFKEYRVVGEWFDITEDGIMDAIEEVDIYDYMKREIVKDPMMPNKEELSMFNVRGNTYFTPEVSFAWRDNMNLVNMIKEIIKDDDLSSEFDNENINEFYLLDKNHGLFITLEFIYMAINVYRIRDLYTKEGFKKMILDPMIDEMRKSDRQGDLERRLLEHYGY